MSDQPVKRYHLSLDRDYQRILTEVTGKELLQFAQYVRSEDYDALKAERDALKAAAEKGTEYVLAQINQYLRTERDALLQEIEILRQYGNKDCTAMADAAIDAARSET